ncbi:uncharacterized protein [Panulirus ornatus]|uniref:uncharacterized protein isoform X2 n=1 Tax=Panulirus ornatus TaxID=150431 RepID=UPI003A8572E7
MTPSAILALAIVSQVAGHLFLQEPPARNVLWRMGFNHLPKHADDDYLICQEKPNARCRPCGDSADTPVKHRHEAGGDWANGIISRTYTIGQTVDVHVNVTRSHGGTVDFKLCPHNDLTSPVEQGCLDQYPLQIVGHRGNKVSLSAAYDDKEQLHLQVKLPPGVTCDQCVLQMTNIADQFKPKKVMFRNCADIAILGNAKTHMAGGPPKHFHFAPRHGPVPIVQQEHRFFKKFS